MLVNWALVYPVLVLASSSTAHGSWVKRSTPLDLEWEQLAPVLDPVSIHVGIKATQDNIHGLIANISDPCHPQYAKYYNQSAIENLITPSKKARRAVDEWLQEHGLEKRSSGHDWFAVEAPAEVASKWLGGAEFHEYEHRNGKRKLHARQYSVPSSVNDHVELLGVGSGSRGGSIGGAGRGAGSSPAAGAGMGAGVGGLRHHHDNDDSDTQQDECNSAPYDVKCLRSLYNMSNYNMQAPDKQRVLVAGFINQHPSLDDLQKYLDKFNPRIGKLNLTSLVNITGGNVAHGYEASLDLQLVASNTLPVHLTFFYTSGNGPMKDRNGHDGKNEPYLEFFSQLVTLPDDELPQVVSISYSDVESTVDRKYATKVCDYIALLGIRGTSVIASSGDDGTGKEEICGDGDSAKFEPVFPASCPYVTAVGGTTDTKNEQVGKDPTLAYASGAGFSEYFERPSYQNDPVNAYMDTANKFRGKFNDGGRAYPDLAMMSKSVAVMVNGTVEGLTGTSSAAPLAASFFAMINDARIAAGQPVLGFLNPILYEHIAPAHGTFRDITRGATSGCGSDAFTATESWDVASGFGAPLFDPVREAALNIQCPS